VRPAIRAAVAKGHRRDAVARFTLPLRAGVVAGAVVVVAAVVADGRSGVTALDRAAGSADGEERNASGRLGESPRRGSPEGLLDARKDAPRTRVATGGGHLAL